MQSALTTGLGSEVGSSLSTATLPTIPVDAAIGQAVGVSLQLASSLAVFALIIFGIRKSFELSFGGKF